MKRLAYILSATVGLAGIVLLARNFSDSPGREGFAGEPTDVGHIAPLGPGSEYGTPVPTAPPINLDDSSAQLIDSEAAESIALKETGVSVDDVDAVTTTLGSAGDFASDNRGNPLQEYSSDYPFWRVRLEGTFSNSFGPPGQNTAIFKVMYIYVDAATGHAVAVALKEGNPVDGPPPS